MTVDNLDIVSNVNLRDVFYEEFAQDSFVRVAFRMPILNARSDAVKIVSDMLVERTEIVGDTAHVGHILGQSPTRRPKILEKIRGSPYRLEFLDPVDTAMSKDLFSPEVSERLKWYVYRLIDPRNGETFYVGKGRGNRIFAHIKGTLRSDGEEDSGDLKVQRIKAIAAAGLEVAHLIHRHGIENEKVAYEIEAALIDAYPGLANRVDGHGAGDYGVRHVREIIAEYAAEPFEVAEPLILISISRSFEDETKDVYDAVRGCWRVDPERAAKFGLVLAHRRGVVVGAFRPTEWVPATKANFPWLEEDEPQRHGFVGAPAEAAAHDRYVHKRVPEIYRAKGAANPVRFIQTSPPPPSHIPDTPH